MKQQIGILGCGWLGIPTARFFLQQAYAVRGSRRSKEGLAQLHACGIDAFPLDLSNGNLEGDMTFFSGLEVLIIAFPPGTKRNPSITFENLYAPLFEQLKKQTINHLILLSSTSVYGDATGVVTEQTVAQPTSLGGQLLLEGERQFQALPAPHKTILRLGGLVGKDRHPVFGLSKKTSIPNPEGVINLVHQSEVIAYLAALIDSPQKNEIYNVVNPYHPSRKAYYTSIAQQWGVALPPFEKNSSPPRMVSADKIIQTHGSHFTVDKLLKESP